MCSVLNLTVLASGSSGNAMVIHTREGGLLIDNGLSRKELLARMDAAELPRDLITAVFLTHDHSDHAHGIRLACDTFKAKLYISANTYEGMKFEKADLPKDSEIILFHPGQPFLHGTLHIDPFKVQHDAFDPVGLVVRYGDLKLGIATDLGKLDNLVMERLKDCCGLVLESNYDLQMLRNSKRPIHLQRRILGPNGHLDNEVAAAALSDLITARTSKITLAHLSKDCNNREIVEDLFRNRLEILQRRDIFIEIASPITPLKTQVYKENTP